jgi:hypothetical protein
MATTIWESITGLRRADLIRERLSSLPLGQVGVWLILSEGAWSQS